MKFLLRTVAAAFVATLVAWLLGWLGTTLPYATWTDAVLVGLIRLGAQAGVFFVLALAGYAALRALLKGGAGRTTHYVAGGAAVGLLAAMISVALVDPGLALRPGLIIGGLLAGFAGGFPISGSGGGPARLTPLR